MLPQVTFAHESGTHERATLNVFVRVVNQFGGSRSPWDFRVTVSGANASPSNFDGSHNGTVVTLDADTHYNVSSSGYSGYSMTTSGACSGELGKNETANCYITHTAQQITPPLPPAPQPYLYPYPYTQQILTCTPAEQTIQLGSVASFSAYGGSATYHWVTSERSYINVGPRISHLFQNPGIQTVTVTSGSQTATCTVNVTGTYGYPVNVTSAYIPNKLPNTGFDPNMGSAMLAFAAVLLIGSGFVVYPYARKVVASIR